MKKLASKAKVQEAKDLRKLHKRDASDHARLAAKAREQSMKLGAQLTVVGEGVYKLGHPVYEELIQPLLNQAAQIGSKYGFNTLFQTQTPLPGMPNYTHTIGAADSRTISTTMQGCIDLISSRPELKIDKHGNPIQTSKEKPFANEAAREVMAQLLYESWADEREYTAWVPGGNSTMQDEARMQIRLALAQVKPAEKSDTDATQ